MKNVCVLGSTGSIGRATLEVIHHLNEVRPQDEFCVFAISCNENISLFKKQVEFFKPKYTCITNPDSAKEFVAAFPNTPVLTGIDGLCELASLPDVDIVLNGLVGAIGVRPTLAAIRAKKRIAMANKETLVAYGELIMKEARKNGSILLPVDSEHSAIHQCISRGGSQLDHVNRIILTASGGPFLNTPITGEITIEDALKHPVWEMGSKITIDSATLMNKGLEVIEASFLFNVPPQKVEVVIHPQSIIHSAVELVDGSILAQLSIPDMRLPIQYALSYPERYPSLVRRLELAKIGRLDFFESDLNKFPCLRLAYESAIAGGTMPCVLNASNEVAVKSFLSKRIRFIDIPEIIEKVMSKHKRVGGMTSSHLLTLSDIEEAERWAIRETESMV